MKKLILVVGLSLAAGSAWAGPSGVWKVEDGTANVEIAPCGEAFCGTVAWADKPDQLDSKNPDISKRNRPVIGTTVLSDMKPAGGNKWSGNIYNVRDGKTYQAKMSMRGDNTLRIEGCIMNGMLCGGQDWARVAQPSTVAAPSAAPAPVANTPVAAPAEMQALTQNVDTNNPAPQPVQQSLANPSPVPAPVATTPDNTVVQPAPAPALAKVRKNTARTNDTDAPQITQDQAGEAARTATQTINRMLSENGIAYRIRPDDADAAGRAATKTINRMLREGSANGFFR